MLIPVAAVVDRAFPRFANLGPRCHVAQVQAGRFQNRARVNKPFFLSLPVVLIEQLLRAANNGAQVLILQCVERFEFHFSPSLIDFANSSNGGSTSMRTIAALISVGSAGFSLRISATSLLSCSRTDLRCPWSICSMRRLRL